MTLDLPRYWLNAEAGLTLNDHMDAPPLGIAFIGPLNDPERSLRISKLENHFTQALMAKSLQRVIDNRETAPAAPVTANPAPEPAQAAPQTTPPADSSAKKVINRILNGIVRDKPR
ncbi:MAG: hypothetical protein EXR08_03385 [Alphaproteobacteria bacterium]|nr:hypothetical protein [Alphaproteobacteria bacterium]